MDPETNAVAQFFAALNRGDVDAAMRDFDPEIVRVEPEGFATAGTYRGRAAVRAHLASGRGTWAEGACEPERIRRHAERVVADLHVRVRLKGATDWLDARFADGFAFRDGRIVEFRSFARRDEADAWAGLTGGDEA